MNKFLALLFIPAVLLGIAFNIGAYNFVKVNQQEFEEIKLSIAANRASDAAVAQLLESTDLGTDYETKGKIRVTPNDALNTFVDVLLFNYGIIPDEYFRQQVKQDFLPVFVVAVNDGFYIAEKQRTTDSVEGSSYELVFTPKLPYTYKVNGKTISLNLAATSYIEVEGNSMVKKEGIPQGLNSKDDVVREINKTIQEKVAYAIESRNELTVDKSENSFFLPAGLTSITGANPIRGTAVLAIVQNVNLSTIKGISTYSVATNEITDRRYVVGYYDNGIKYYAYADSLPAEIVSNENNQIFITAKQAAEAGYFPDLSRLN